MAKSRPLLLVIEDFLADFPMGESYFGQKAAGNSKLVPRLRAGRPIEVETDRRVREWIRLRRLAGKRRARASEQERRAASA